jgi:cell division protein ZipA
MDSFTGNLRLFLLIVGIVIIALVLAYTYYKTRLGKDRKWRDLQEFDDYDGYGNTRIDFSDTQRESIDTDLLDDLPPIWIDEEQTVTRPRPATSKAATEKPAAKPAVKPAPKTKTAPRQAMPYYFILNVLVKSEETFSGDTVLQTLEELGLRFGDMDIYHYYPEAESAEPVYSIADALNPGYLKPDDLPGRGLKGLSLFMELPNPMSGEQAYDQMLEAGKRLAWTLNGSLCDETRSVLTPQTISHHKERIAEYNRQSKLEQA